jgi:hypothetical protein
VPDGLGVYCSNIPTTQYSDPYRFLFHEQASLILYTADARRKAEEKDGILCLLNSLR